MLLICTSACTYLVIQQESLTQIRQHIARNKHTLLKNETDDTSSCDADMSDLDLEALKPMSDSETESARKSSPLPDIEDTIMDTHIEHPTDPSHIRYQRVNTSDVDEGGEGGGRQKRKRKTDLTCEIDGETTRYR